MTKARKASLPPGYIMADEAAQILGVSQVRMYQYINEDRIPSYKIGRSYMMRIEDVEKFKAHPTGRTRTQPPVWHPYKDAKVFVTDICVPVPAHNQSTVQEKLHALVKSNQHVFPGTIARYVVQEDEQPENLHIILVWKSTEMPEEEVRQNHLASFQSDFADIVDWNKARVKTSTAIIHT